MPICFEKHLFHPIIKLPKDYAVCDFSKNNFQDLKTEYSIGRYNEKRPFLYKQDEFIKEKRTIHMGLDIGAPSGTPIYAPLDGRIFLFKDNNKEGDYGPTLITAHHLDGFDFYILFGHLSRQSLENKKKGAFFKKASVLGFVGCENENGHWPCHVHIQLSYLKPKEAHLPGVVSEKDHKWALDNFPDPRLILGLVY